MAQTGKATQSSTDYAGPAEYAIDGNTDGEFENKSVTHTAMSDNPWWEVDLGSDTAIERLTIWNEPAAAFINDLPISASRCSMKPAKSSGNKRLPNLQIRPPTISPAMCGISDS